MLSKTPALIGRSQAIQHLKRIIEKVRLRPTNVLVTGETGTGKEIVARSLAFPPSSTQKRSIPFIAIDSATIQSSVAESLLFGHEKGAFTGADHVRKGIFEEAQGGIVYFDEIGNMPLSIQSKLLRVLQEKEITRLGSSRPISLEFRVICATNQSLETSAEKGAFKEDLLQRLNVFPIHLPPLRERMEDVPLLLHHFIQTDHPALHGFHFSDETLAILLAYPWPGNVREVRNLVSYLAVLWEGGPVQPQDLPPKFSKPTVRKADEQPEPALEKDSTGELLSLSEQMRHFEKKVLRRAFDEQNGNIARISVSLRVDRSHLYTKLKAHGIYQGVRQRRGLSLI